MSTAIGPLHPVICPPPFHTVKVTASSNDPGQHVKKLAGSNLFNITGTAINSGTSTLALTVDGQKIKVRLSRGMTPVATLEAIRHALPQGYEAQGLTSPPESITVRLTRGLVSLPAPKLEVNLANDPMQRVAFSGGNTLTFRGTATNDDFIPSLVNLTVDGKRVHVRVSKGDTALDTARAISAALPQGYKGVIEWKGAHEASLSIVRG